MTQVMEQTPNDGGGPTDQRAIYVSDGYINLAILARENPEGINHFWVPGGRPRGDCTGGQGFGAQTGIAPRPRDGRYAESHIHDRLAPDIEHLATAGLATEPETAAAVAARVGH